MSYPVYSLEDEIAAFFDKTSVTRQKCDNRAKDLFRFKSLELKTETTILAKQLYGTLVPEVLFVGQLGDDDIAGKEPLYIYLANRVRGVTHLEFNLGHDRPANSQENFAWRKTLMGDMARFFALSWKSPQLVDQSYRSRLSQTYASELGMLLTALPARFHVTIQSCIDSLDSIFSLPMVLLHEDFGDCNIMVDETTCHLVGVIDWAEAKIGPFGLNLFCLESISGKLHLRNGRSRYEDYHVLQDTFWDTFKQEVGGVTDDNIRAIRVARDIGVLLSYGFTSRLANEQKHVPIGTMSKDAITRSLLMGFL